LDIDINIETNDWRDMSTQPLLVRIPEELVRRLRRKVPLRQRSKFVAQLLEQALPPDEASDSDPLFQAALAVERDEALAAEMAEWEAATSGDGFSRRPPQTPKR
jgi:hypothetical protein